MNTFQNFINTSLENYRNQINIASGVFVAISGGLLYGRNTYAQNQTLFWISIGIITLMLIFLIIVNVYKFKNKGPVEPKRDKISTKFIRGLLPFENGQELLGRDSEAADLLTKVESLNFRFGYVSGEAGTGKTSFLRSKFNSIIADKQKFRIIYLPDTQEDVFEKIKRERKIISTQIAENSLDILIIIDQFEEFFIKNPTKEKREEFAKEVKQLFEDKEIHIIISLRKEFVEDLRDFKPYIQNPKNDNFSVYIQNWDKTFAEKIFKLFVKEDNIPFSNELISEIISDLSSNEIIRPVELQLVSRYLVDKKFYTYSDYKAIGGSQGILVNIIKEHIDKADTPLQKFCIQFVLRSLCDDAFDAKRSDGGLAKEVILDQLKKVIKNSDKSFKTATEETIKQDLENSINISKEDGFVQFNDEQKLNLTHDYIVKSIKKATADLQTAEEKANYLIKYYLDQKVNIPNITVPFKDYKFIQKYASSTVLAEHGPHLLMLKTKQKINNLKIVYFFILFLAVISIGWLTFQNNYSQKFISSIKINVLKNLDSGYVIYEKSSKCYLGNLNDTFKTSILLPYIIEKQAALFFNPKSKLISFIDTNYTTLYIYSFNNVRKLTPLKSFQLNIAKPFNHLILVTSSPNFYDISKGVLKRRDSIIIFTVPSFPSSKYYIFSINKLNDCLYVKVDSIKTDVNSYGFDMIRIAACNDTMLLVLNYDNFFYHTSFYLHPNYSSYYYNSNTFKIDTIDKKIIDLYNSQPECFYFFDNNRLFITHEFPENYSCLKQLKKTISIENSVLCDTSNGKYLSIRFISNKIFITQNRNDTLYFFNPENNTSLKFAGGFRYLLDASLSFLNDSTIIANNNYGSSLHWDYLLKYSTRGIRLQDSFQSHSVNSFQNYSNLKNGFFYFDSLYNLKILNLKIANNFYSDSFYKASNARCTAIWAEDNIAILDDNKLFYGNMNDLASNIISGDANESIKYAITSKDRKHLIVLKGNRLFMIDRYKEIFGIKFYYQNWPTINWNIYTN